MEFTLVEITGDDNSNANDLNWLLAISCIQVAWSSSMVEGEAFLSSEVGCACYPEVQGPSEGKVEEEVNLITMRVRGAIEVKVKICDCKVHKRTNLCPVCANKKKQRVLC